MKDLVVVGGGITGLSAAYIAAKEGKKVTVIEASRTFGGLLNTFEIGGNRLERYYHHFFTHDKELNWLIKDLHLDDQVIFKKTSMGVFKNGVIYPFDTPYDLLKFNPIKFFDKIKFGLTSVFLGKYSNWKNHENVSCINWFNKWAGKSSTESLWAPLLNIKFGSYASQVPLSWMIGRLRQRMNSRKNGDERLGYLDGSLQILLDKLLDKLREMDVELIAGQPIEEINFQGNEISHVKTFSREYSGNQYLFTIPGIYLGRLLEKKQSELGNELSNIKYFGAVCVILELNKPLSKIYWLNIADKGFPFGGVIEHTNFIESDKYNGSHIAYLSRYFSMEEEISKMTDDEIKNLMLKYLPKIYPDFDEGLIKNLFIFRTNTAATVCDINFSKKIPSCKTTINNMFIVNMSHVYPDERSTNNSIKIASEACRVMGIGKGFGFNTNSLSGKIGF